MFGNGLYNPYMASSYYQAANLAGLGRLGGTAGLGRLGGANMASSIAKGGIGSGIGKGLLSKFSFSGFLNGASKTLNVVNQAIPIFYQVKPMINNAKTMFKIMGAVKDDSGTSNNKSVVTNNTVTDIKTEEKNNSSLVETNNYSSGENPTFFI